MPHSLIFQSAVSHKQARVLYIIRVYKSTDERRREHTYENENVYYYNIISYYALVQYNIYIYVRPLPSCAMCMLLLLLYYYTYTYMCDVYKNATRSMKFTRVNIITHIYIYIILYIIV